MGQGYSQYFCNNTSVFLQHLFAFLQHVPSTQSLNWPRLIQKTWCYRRGAPTDLLWSKKPDVTDVGPQLTSFDPKNVMLQTRGPIWPPLIQNTWRFRRGASTDLLWSKKRDVTDVGPQLTSFDPKNVMLQTTRGPNWPPSIQKTLPLPTWGSNWPLRCLDTGWLVCLHLFILVQNRGRC